MCPIDESDFKKTWYTKPYIINIIYRVGKVISLYPSQLFFALWTSIE